MSLGCHLDTFSGQNGCFQETFAGLVDALQFYPLVLYTLYTPCTHFVHTLHTLCSHFTHALPSNSWPIGSKAVHVGCHRMITAIAKSSCNDYDAAHLPDVASVH
eukprot:scpid109067/ scgid23189/ 